MPDSTLKPELLQRYAGGRKVFVETGTARGEGLQSALDFGRFNKLYSIEANADVYAAACARFVGEKKVELFLGDGGQVLQQLLPRIQEPAVFWLDSHWGTGEPPLAEGMSPCPLLAELCAIAEHPIKDHVILIDDIRYFRRGLPQWGNITLGEITMILMEINADYWMRFEEGCTKGDILVAVPIPQETILHEAVEEAEKWVK